jgi:DNA-binding PadR family transcriptional regulator
LGESQTNLLQGTLGLLILKAIGDSEFHGLGISRRIEQITHGTFRVKPGSLFPALHRGGVIADRSERIERES